MKKKKGAKIPAKGKPAGEKRTVPSKGISVDRKINKSLFLVIGLFAVLLYANTINHEWAFDDFPTIYGNSLTMSGLEGIPMMLKTAYWYGLDGQNDWLYRPLSLIMFAIEWEFWPDNPTAGHVINILFYALGGILMFMLLRLMFRNENQLLPLICTLFFLAHPLHTEVVANIKSRDEIMSMLFGTLALFMILHYIDKDEFKYLAYGAVAYFLSLFSKESAITFLGVFPLTIFFFRDATVKRNITASAFMLAPAALYLIIRGSVLTSQTGMGEISIADNTLVAAPDLIHQLGTAFYILGLYLKDLVFPYPLASDYSFAQIPIVSFTNPLALFALVFHLFIGAYALFNLKNKNVIAYSILYYLGTLALVTNVLFLTKSTMADRFLYAPSFGFAIALGYLLCKLFKSDRTTVYKKASLLFTNNKTLFAVTILILLAGTLRTMDRNADWKNDYTIFSADIKHSPNSARLHFLFANHLTQSLNQGIVPANKQEEYYQTALKEFSRCIEIFPDYYEAYFGLGEAYTKRNQHDKAISYYKIVIEKSPGYTSGYNNLGNAYFRAGNNELAISTFKKAIEINPKYSEAYNNLGTVYFTQSNYKAAEQSYLQAIQHNSRYVDALKNLGSTYGTMQQFDLSIKYFLEALKYDPNNAEINYFLGMTYNGKGDNTNGRLYLEKAYRLNPKLRPN